MPGRQRRRGARRHARRRARRVPRAGVAVRRAARREPVQHRAGDAAAHRGRGGGGRRRVEDWQDSSCAVLGRRLVFAADEYYLLAGRPFPRAETYEGFPMHEDGIGMARTFELEFHGRVARRRPVRRPGFFAWVDAPPQPERPTDRPARTRLRRRRGAADARAAARRAGRHPHRRVRRPGARAAASTRSAATTCGWSRSQRVLRRQHGVTGLMVGDDLPRVLADEPDGHRYLLPDVCLSRGPLPRRHHASPTCPARSRSSPPTASRCARRWACR